MKIVRRWYDWIGSQVHQPYAVPLLGFLFFIESIILIPIDPLLALYCIEYPSRSWYFAGIATIASVGGGLISYAIGAFCWDIVGYKIVTLFFSPESFIYAKELCCTYQAYALLIGGLLPIPYKLLTLSAGFLRFPILSFIIYSTIARSMRFFLIATVFHYSGQSIKQFIDRHLTRLVLFALGVIGLIIFVVKIR